MTVGVLGGACCCACCLAFKLGSTSGILARASSALESRVGSRSAWTSTSASADTIGFVIVTYVSSDCDVPVCEKGERGVWRTFFCWQWCKPAVLRVALAKAGQSPRVHHRSSSLTPRIRAACSALKTMFFPRGHTHGLSVCEPTHNAESARVSSHLGSCDGPRGDVKRRTWRRLF